MNLQQLPQCHTLERPIPPAVMVLEELCGILRAEALDHTSIIQRGALYVQEDSFRLCDEVRLFGGSPAEKRWDLRNWLRTGTALLNYCTPPAPCGSAKRRPPDQTNGDEPARRARIGKHLAASGESRSGAVPAGPLLGAIHWPEVSGLLFR